MFFHILLTTECDLQCKYCYVKSCEDIDSDFSFKVDYSLPRKLDIDIDELATFCSKDPDCVLSFYGGEPFLCLDKLMQIMDKVRAKQFLVQTNGLHLDRLEPKYVNRLHTILVSIDGDQKLTDYYRGAGTYRKLITNLATIRQNDFRGEIIARMTVMEETDIAREVKWLLSNNDFNFTSIHWQLDAGFWKNDFAKRPFKKWVKESYNPGIQRLVQFWIDEMERNGKVLRLYPFLGIMRSLLNHENSLLRCGSGWINYTIQTNGYIIPCPAMSGMVDYYLGHVSTTNPQELEQVFVSKPCTECIMLNQCGGRCLYANITKRWTPEAYSLICGTVRNLVISLKEKLPKVEQLIAENGIGLADFNFMKYNGCEIIP